MRLVLHKTITWLALVAALAAGYGFGNLHDGPLPLVGTNDSGEVVAAEPGPETESPRSAEAVSEPRPEPEPADSTPPPLAVTSPADGAVFAETTESCDHHSDQDHDACAQTTESCDHDGGEGDGEVKN